MIGMEAGTGTKYQTVRNYMVIKNEYLKKALNLSKTFFKYYYEDFRLIISFFLKSGIVF